MIFADYKIVKKFTIVELLTVISIIAILAALLLPVLSNSRRQVKLTQCANNLKQLGVAFGAYVSNYDDHFPNAGRQPTINTSLPRVADLLEPYSGGTAIFKCPADNRPETDYGGIENKTFFEAEGSSYEYISEPVKVKGHYKDSGSNIEWSDSQLPIMYDYEAFHLDLKDYDEENVPPGARNYLFLDGHVSDKLY